MGSSPTHATQSSGEGYASALGRWITFRVLGVVLVVVVVAIFARCGFFEFVRLDDHDYTFLCPFVKDGFSWRNLCEAFSNLRHAAIWMPLTYLSYMLGISAFGAGMAQHHLINVAIHAANAFLFFRLLLGLWGAEDSPRHRAAQVCAFVAAAFWALHPLRVEPVCWIAGRKELLCGLFVLLGLLAWNRRAWFVGMLCCAAACLSKPTAMCFPFLAFAVELAFGSRPSSAGRRSLVAAVARYLPLLLMAAATGAIAVYSQTHADGYDVRRLYTAGFGLRLANSFTALGTYLFAHLIPLALHADVPFPVGGVPWSRWLAALAGYAVVAVPLMSLLVRNVSRATIPNEVNERWRTGIVLLAVALFFLASVTPVLGLFGSFGREAYADRFTYIPSMAVSIALFQALKLMGPGISRSRRFMARVKYPLGVLVLVLMAITWRQVGYWRNDYTLFSRVLECDDVHARAFSHVASEECARFGRFDDGIAHFRRSLELEWNVGTAAQLAFALATRGRADDSAEIRQCCRSAVADPASDRKGLMLEALGMTALKERKWDEAVRWLYLAAKAPARLHPADDARARLGVALANGGRTADAEKVFSALARPGAARESVRAFAERALLQLSSSSNILLFY